MTWSEVFDWLRGLLILLSCGMPSLDMYEQVEWSICRNRWR